MSFICCRESTENSEIKEYIDESREEQNSDDDGKFTYIYHK